jgi:hypothetical protein
MRNGENVLRLIRSLSFDRMELSIKYQEDKRQKSGARLKKSMNDLFIQKNE